MVALWQAVVLHGGLDDEEIFSVNANDLDVSESGRVRVRAREMYNRYHTAR